MPIESVPGTAVQYHLIAFDAAGNERRDDPDGIMSERLLAALRTEPITDIFILSHGWQGDIPAAREQYNRWIAAMALQTADLQRARAERPGFRALLVGLHWPSLPWGDEEFGAGGASFAPGGNALFDQAVLIEQYAERIADTPAARAALETIFSAARQEIAPPVLPPNVVAAYHVLDREAGLDSAGPGATPGADREPFDPEATFEAAEAEAVSFGSFDMGGLLAPLRQLSFWKMKDRARLFGESGAHLLLRQLLQQSGPNVQVHLMGHSFGCIVVSGMLAGPRGQGKLQRPVTSVALVQGALSHWSYCADIPVTPGRPGYFHAVVSPSRVVGPIITTQSTFDTAVGRFYPIGAGLARQVDFAPGALPKYGALGAYGARGSGITVVDQPMLPADGVYQLNPATIYNLDSNKYIRNGAGASGAHSDIVHPEVAHAVWAAALSGSR